MSDNDIEARRLRKEVCPETPRGLSEGTHQPIIEAKVEDGPAEDQHGAFIPPNGGLEAWLLVLAGFLVFVNTWGITSTFGAFQAYYQHNLLATSTSSAISWIGSIQAFLVVSVGVVVGPLFDRGYLRPLVTTGCALTVLGLMTTSLASSYPAVLLAQGVCTGLGEGMTYVPVLAVISTHFTTKRPIAIGMASLGSSAGGIAFPILFRSLQPSIGFAWTVRALAFIALALALLSLAILARHPPPPQPATPRPLLDLPAFRSPHFTLFALSLFLLFTAYYIPLFYIVAFARTSLHMSPTSATALLSITNASSTLGRTAPYLLGPRVKPIYTLLLWSSIGALLLFVWPAIHTAAGFTAWCVLWGCVAGVLVTAPTAALAHPVMAPSLGVIGTRMGMAWGFAAAGSLVGAPIAGALADVGTAPFLHAQMFAGAVMAGGVAALVWPLVAVERYDSSRAKAREGARETSMVVK